MSKYYYKKRRRSTSQERMFTDRTPVYQYEVLKKCSLEDPFTIRERLQKLEQEMFDRNKQLDTITHLTTILDLKYTGFIHKLNKHVKTRKKLLEIIKKEKRKQNKGSVDPVSSFLQPSSSTDVLIKEKENEKHENIDINTPSTSAASDDKIKTKETEIHENVLSPESNNTVADAKNKFPRSSVSKVLEESLKYRNEDKKHVDDNIKEPTPDSSIPHIDVSTLDESSTNLDPQNIIPVEVVREPKELHLTEPAICEFEIIITDISNILENDSVQGLLELSVEPVTSDDASLNINVAVQDSRKVLLSDDRADISITASTELDNPIDVSDAVSPSVDEKSDISIAASTELDISLEVEESSSEDVLDEVPSKIHEKADNICKELLKQALHTVFKTPCIATDSAEFNVIDEYSSSKEPEESTSKELKESYPKKLKESFSEEIVEQASSTMEEKVSISKELLKQALITLYTTSYCATGGGTDSNVLKEIEYNTLMEELKQALMDDKSEASATNIETDIAKKDEKLEMNVTVSNVLQESKKRQCPLAERADDQALTKVDKTSDINDTAQRKRDSDIPKESDKAQNMVNEKNDIIIAEVEKSAIIMVDEKADISVISAGSESSKQDEERSLQEVSEKVSPAPDENAGTSGSQNTPTVSGGIPYSILVAALRQGWKREREREISGKRYNVTPEHDYRLDLFEKLLKKEKASRARANPDAADESLKIVICDQNPMDDDKLKTLQFELVFEARRHFDSTRFMPRFDGMENKNNCLYVTCTDQRTLDWVKGIIKRLKPWKGGQLEVKDQMPKPLPAILHANCITCMTDESFIRYIKQQNPQLNIQEWKMYHTDYRAKDRMRLMYFAIPASSLKELEKTKHWVNYKTSKMYVQVKVQENSEMKVPIKPSKKPRIKGDVRCGFR